MTQRGCFITLEGGEGAGKSTQLKALEAALQEKGIDCLVTREPGGSPGAEAIRELLLGGEEGRWSVRTEALLFAAARSDHVEKTIKPALESGKWVISDRFLDSSLAYQGGAGGLGYDLIRDLHRLGTESFLPDRTLVLQFADEQALDRARARDEDASDRIGGRPLDYHLKVSSAFRHIAKEEPDRVWLIDASGEPQAVTRRLLSAIKDLLP